MEYKLIFTGILSSFLISFGGTTTQNVGLSYSSIHRFPNSLPNVDIQVTKSCDLKSGTCSFTSNSSLVRTADDLVKLEQDEGQAIRKKFGAISGTAIDTYQKLKGANTMRITVSVKEPEGIHYLDKTQNSYADLLWQSQSISELKPLVSIEELTFGTA